jgi:hypothetical protein
VLRKSRTLAYPGKNETPATRRANACRRLYRASARDDRLPTDFVGDWCFAAHMADHLAFYRRGRCANSDNVGDWLTINPDSFDVHEMHCQVLVARSNKRGDYLAKFRCDDNQIQNYWFSLFNDRLYVSQTDTEP